MIHAIWCELFASIGAKVQCLDHTRIETVLPPRECLRDEKTQMAADESPITPLPVEEPLPTGPVVKNVGEMEI